MKGYKPSLVSDKHFPTCTGYRWGVHIRHLQLCQFAMVESHWSWWWYNHWRGWCSCICEYKCTTEICHSVTFNT